MMSLEKEQEEAFKQFSNLFPSGFYAKCHRLIKFGDIALIVIKKDVVSVIANNHVPSVRYIYE